MIKSASGFRDFIGSTAAHRNHMIRVIQDVYASFGAQPISTPALEPLSILLGKEGGENEKLIFKVLKRGEKFEQALNQPTENHLSDLGLRFDLTIPLCRLMSSHPITLPWKAYHIGNVWRAERAQQGRYREFIQCDLDILGSPAPLAEIEVLSAALKALEKLHITPVQIKINHRALLSALRAYFKIDETLESPLFILLDKKDKLEPEKLAMDLKALVGTDTASQLTPWIDGKMDKSLLQSIHPKAFEQIQSLLSFFPNAHLDLSLVRGMGYYTGLIYEITHPKSSSSIGGGGRYDQLVEKLSQGKTSTIACGVSLGFERLALLLQEQEQRTPSYFLPLFQMESLPELLTLAEKIRSFGFKADIFPGFKPLKAQLQYAKNAHHHCLLFRGEQEKKQGILKAQLMQSNVSQSFSWKDGDFLEWKELFEFSNHS